MQLLWVLLCGALATTTTITITTILRTAVLVHGFSVIRNTHHQPHYDRQQQRRRNGAVMTQRSMTATNDNKNTNNTPASSTTRKNRQGEEEDGRQRRRLKKQNKYNNNNNHDDIMKDASGHVNRELAENLWKWEQNSRQARQLPKVEYSVRSGLRLVDEQVKELSLAGRRSVPNTISYADLVQEGLTALLDAMSHYRREEQHDNNNNNNDNNKATHEDEFEDYAAKQIRQHLEKIVDQNVRPIRLPKRVQTVLRAAKQASRELLVAEESSTSDDTRRRPSVAAVAAKMNIPVEQLQDYLRLTRRRTLSMESTVEVSSPQINDDAAFVDQEDWEISQNMVRNDGHTVHKDELIDEFLDETIELEGDDQAWIHQEQIAGPLQDVIPDRQEPSPDDSVLMDVIRQDMSDFLDSTLDPVEIRVVRMIFGLDSGRQTTIKRTAQALDMEPGQVSLLLAGSLEKLRASYQSRYVEPYLDDENMVDSV